MNKLLGLIAGVIGLGALCFAFIGEFQIVRNALPHGGIILGALGFVLIGIALYQIRK